MNSVIDHPCRAAVTGYSLPVVPWLPVATCDLPPLVNHNPVIPLIPFGYPCI